MFLNQDIIKYNSVYFNNNDLSKLSDIELLNQLEAYLTINTEKLENICNEITTRKIDKNIDFARKDIELREKIRERCVNQNFGKKYCWGLLPKLRYRIEDKLDAKKLDYIIQRTSVILFWKPSTFIFPSKYKILEREYFLDFNQGKAKIGFKLDNYGNLLLKCMADGSIVFDNERNIRTLKQFLKLYELIKSEINAL